MRVREISDPTWAVVEPLLPSGGRARGRWRDHRHVLEGIVFKFRTGLPWRDLPERFGPSQTVHGRFARWAADGHLRPPAVRRSVPGGGGLAGRDRLHDRAGHQLAGRKRRRERPCGFDKAAYRRRNVVERCFHRLKQWRGIAAGYDKRPDRYLAAVTLASTLIWLDT